MDEESIEEDREEEGKKKNQTNKHKHWNRIYNILQIY